MTSHFLVPFNTWFLTGPTSRQCALYLGNKDPIREGRGVRAGLDLSVQISHQSGTDHQIGLFSGEDFSWPRAGHRVTIQSFWGVGGHRGFSVSVDSDRSQGGCSFAWSEYMICDIHLMFPCLKPLSFVFTVAYILQYAVLKALTLDCLWGLIVAFFPRFP